MVPIAALQSPNECTFLQVGAHPDITLDAEAM